jgi:hypothetical protein
MRSAEKLIHQRDASYNSYAVKSSRTEIPQGQIADGTFDILISASMNQLGRWTVTSPIFSRLTSHVVLPFNFELSVFTMYQSRTNSQLGVWSGDF